MLRKPNHHACRFRVRRHRGAAVAVRSRAPSRSPAYRYPAFGIPGDPPRRVAPRVVLATIALTGFMHPACPRPRTRHERSRAPELAGQACAVLQNATPRRCADSVQQHHAEAPAQGIVHVAAIAEVLHLVARVRHHELEIQALPERVLNGAESLDLVVGVHLAEVLPWVGVDAEILVAVPKNSATEHERLMTRAEIHEPAKSLHGITIGQIRVAVLVQKIL